PVSGSVQSRLCGLMARVIFVFSSCLLLLLLFIPSLSPPDLSPLSLHDALPISLSPYTSDVDAMSTFLRFLLAVASTTSVPYTFVDRKSTRLNSSHQIISYAVFCLKKKKITHNMPISD